jgi:hypothetical protein
MKKKRKPSHLTIIIFPNLFIDEKISFDKLEIKPSLQEIVNKEVSTTQKLIQNLRKLFLRSNGKPITHFSYVITLIGSEKAWWTLVKKFRKFTNILLFEELSSSWTAEPISYFHFFVFEFTPNQMKNIANLNRYDASLNGETPVIFFIRKNRIIMRPPCYTHEQKNLSDIFGNKLFQHLYLFADYLFTKEEYPRFIRAIEWYNRSFYKPVGFDESEAIINLETAFESLFKVSDEQSGISQVKSGICYFLGSTPDLRTWVDEFWRTRNQIVHGDVDIPSFKYKPLGSGAEYFRHVRFARRVFAQCLQRIIELRKALPVEFFHEEMKPNDVRMKEALKLLRKAKHKLKKAHKNGSLKIIKNLKEGDLSADLEQSIVFGKEFLHLVLLSLDKQNQTEVRLAEIIRAIIHYDKDEFDKLNDLYFQAYHISPWHFIDRYNETRREFVELGYAYESFMDYMNYRWLMKDF